MRPSTSPFLTIMCCMAGGEVGDLDVTIAVKAAPVPKRSGPEGDHVVSGSAALLSHVGVTLVARSVIGAWLRSLGVSSGYAPLVLEVIAMASSPRRASRKAQWRGGSAH